jgi:hypothetical protein
VVIHVRATQHKEIRRNGLRECASRRVLDLKDKQKKAGSSSTIAAGTRRAGQRPKFSSSRYFFGALPQPEEPGCYAGAHPIRQIDRQAHEF